MRNMTNLLEVQRKLFEAAHTEATELKPLGIAIKREGIDTSKQYCNPNFLLLPFNNCPYLSELSDEQISILTAVYFAGTYAEIASSETLALKYNMVATELAFDMYSDDYMVLFHETAEEFDHIITFRSACQGILGRGDVVGVHHFDHLSPIQKTFTTFRNKLCSNGFCSMYLLMRYLLNLALKQLESFMAVDIDEDKKHASAMGIIQGHSIDEARHITTSLELGLGLFEKAQPESQKLVRAIIKQALFSMIRKRFSSKSNLFHFSAGKNALERALTMEAFESFPLDIESLSHFWSNENISPASSQAYLNSQEWIAQQINRVLESLDINLKSTSEPFERFKEVTK